MSLQHLALERIDSVALNALIQTAARESSIIDYKQTLALGSPDEKREFLFDVASFANSGGGDLVYGVRAQDGVPDNLIGLAGLIPDKSQLQIEDILRSCLFPRLNGVGFQTVPISDGASVFIIRVPRSLNSPHMVRVGTWSKFYGRNSTGKYELDVHEIRHAFLASEGALTRLRDFRLERINRILRDDLGLKFVSPLRLVLHVLPVSTLRGELTFSISQLYSARQNMPPFGSVKGWGLRVNFDGVVIESHGPDRTELSALQLFRNGSVESVDALSLQHWDDMPILHAHLVEQSIREGFPAVIDYLTRLDVAPPYVVGLSLLNVRDRVIQSQNVFALSGIRAIAQDHLILPEITVEELPVSVDQLFRPLFDLIWNACGYQRSLSYDDQGRWRQPD